MRISPTHGILVGMFSALALTCSDSAGPSRVDPTELNWRIDSVRANAFQVNFEDVWGSSSSNIYVVGGSSDNSQKVYHFDGSVLSQVMVPRPAYPNDDRDFRAIAAQSSGRIWLVGKRDRFNFNPPPNYFDSSFVISSTSTDWTVMLEGVGRGLLSVLPRNENEILFGGMFGTLLSFDGISWAHEVVRSDVGIHALIDLPNGDVYALCYSMDLQDPVSDRILLRNGSGWTTIDSINVSSGYSHFGTNGAVVFKGDLMTCGPGLYRRVGGAWQTIYAGNDNYLSDVTSYGDSGVLACGSNGRAIYYDGVTVRPINLPTGIDTRLTGIWSDGTCIAIVGYSGDQGHGLFLFGSAKR